MVFDKAHICDWGRFNVASLSLHLLMFNDATVLGCVKFGVASFSLNVTSYAEWINSSDNCNSLVS